MLEAITLWLDTSSMMAARPTLVKKLLTMAEFMTPSSNQTPLSLYGEFTFGSELS